jgi:hypothetical protein
MPKAHAPAQMNPAQHAAVAKNNNKAIRQHILQRSVVMIQPMQSISLVPNVNIPNVLNATLKNVGLLRKIYLEVTVNFSTAAGTTSCVRSPFGPSNIFSQVVFTDFQNQARHTTTGWHLSMINSVKQKATGPIGSAETTDTPLGFGNVYGSIASPATVAASTNAVVSMVYEVPIAYSDTDLRGAIYMATTGAIATIAGTLNPQFFALAAADQTLSCYTYAGTAPTVTSVQLTVYQEYLDQLPTGQNGKPLLPEQDLDTVYSLLTTSVSGLSVNTPFGIPYTNLRSFLSTTVIYDNGGTLNAGTDITTMGIQSANLTYLQQLTPRMISYRTRKMLGVDAPIGTYYFDHRQAPISTAQFGNMQLVVLPSQVNANAQVLTGYEFMAPRRTITQAASLPNG